MLLPINPGTPLSTVFTELNDLVGYFLARSIDSHEFTSALFCAPLRDVIWENEPTKNLFHYVWKDLHKLTREERENISTLFVDCQEIRLFFSDKNASLPNISESLESSLGNLCKHLFKQTSKLSGVISVCGETIQDHFLTFRSESLNGNVCCFCGTEVLAQIRSNVSSAKQWRAPYDHLLTKDKYPIFAVHPENLLPTCSTCNHKAKHVKDLIRDDFGNRRLSFFTGEFACQLVAFAAEGSELGRVSPAIKLKFSPSCIEEVEKIATWDSVYQISNRVEQEFAVVIEKISEDFGDTSFDFFRTQLDGKARHLLGFCRKTPWSFWKSKMYECLATQSELELKSIWDAMQANRDDENSLAVYGI